MIREVSTDRVCDWLVHTHDKLFNPSIRTTYFCKITHGLRYREGVDLRNRLPSAEPRVRLVR